MDSRLRVQLRAPWVRVRVRVRRRVRVRVRVRVQVLAPWPQNHGGH